jgi:hypothetical protein
VRRADRTIGIALGIVLGLAIVIAFVFFGSEDTIDAPSLSGEGGQPAQTAPAEPQQTVPAQPPGQQP